MPTEIKVILITKRKVITIWWKWSTTHVLIALPKGKLFAWLEQGTIVKAKDLKNTVKVTEKKILTQLLSLSLEQKEKQNRSAGDWMVGTQWIVHDATRRYKTIQLIIK